MRAVAVDVGGTFTDVVYVDEAGSVRVAKVLSTPRRPEEGVMRAVSAVSPGPGYEVLHATTVATNAMLGQVGLELPKTALLTTRGFRDVIEIGRQSRPRLYDLSFRRPRPLVPRGLRYEVDERTLSDGTVLRRLNEDDVVRLAEDMASKGVESVAVSFINAHVNPENEARAAQALRKYFRFVTAGHEVVREPREYERTSTAVVNAVLTPIVTRYLEVLWPSLKSFGASSLYDMSSAGGLVDVVEAAARPVQLIESGPAAGAIAAAWLSRELGLDGVIGFDMGGTTAKASSTARGEVEVTTEFEVGGEVQHGRVVKGSGYPVRFPFVDLAEVSAGGGTIIWRDQAGALRVGPLSAGSDPGPASYGRGGTSPTLTDAAVLLGWLGGVLAGGEVRLRPELATKALTSLGEPVEVAVEAVELASLEMARAVRLVTVERGLDPTGMAIIAFGGAGPQYAPFIAEEIGCGLIVVPPDPGLFSAYGLLVSDSKFEASAPASGDLENVFRSLEASLARRLGRVDYFVRELEARYSGQGWELVIRAPPDLSPSSIKEAFDRAHMSAYGFTLDRPVEVVTARVFAIASRRKPALRGPPTHGEVRPKGVRGALIGNSWDEVPVYDRGSLPAGAVIDGPAIVEEFSSTTIVPRGWRLRVDHRGPLLITR